MTLRVIFAWLLTLIFVVSAISACGESGSSASPAAAPPPPPRFAARSELSEIVVTGARAAEAAQQQRRIAMSHDFTVRLPSSQIEAAQKRHLEECVKLGCEVLESSLNRADEQRVRASINVRLPPPAFETFVALLGEAPGRITAHSETAEDKTLEFIEVEKRLEIKIALRDRLMAMLRDPARKDAADLAVVEKELAQVQGDIETSTAQRNYLVTLTETLAVRVDYFGTTAEAGGFDLTPLQRSFAGFGRTIVTTLALVVDLFATLLVWLPLVILAGWIARRGYRRWKARRTGF